MNLDTLPPLQRYPLEELQHQSSTGYRVVDRWLQALEASDDAKTRDLLSKFRAQDKVNAAEQSMRLRPLEDLLEHLLCRVLKQILLACDSTPDAVTAIVTARDIRKRTILHLAAEQGNSNMVELLLQAVAPEDRGFFADAVDGGGASFKGLELLSGYTAAHLARLAGYIATAEKIESLGLRLSESEDSVSQD